MYTLEKFEKSILVADYMRDYINVQEFLHYCRR